MSQEKLAELIEKSQEEDGHKTDQDVSVAAIEFEEDGRLNLTPGADFGLATLDLTDHSLGQLCAKTAKYLHGRGSGVASLPVKHIRQVRQVMPDVFADTFNRLFWTRANGQIWKIRMYDDNARAILSQHYADIANTEMLQMAQEALQDGDYRIANRAYVNADRISVQFLLGDDLSGPDGGTYMRGVGVFNDEIGTGSAKVAPIVKRDSCDNSIVWIDGGVAVTHKGNKAAKNTLLAAAMVEVLPKTESMLDEFFAKQKQALPNIADVIRGLGSKYQIPAPAVDTALMGTEGEQTAAAVVNAFTFAAHRTPDLDQTERDRLEAISGELLFAKAKRLVDTGEAYAMAERRRVRAMA